MVNGSMGVGTFLERPPCATSRGKAEDSKTSRIVVQRRVGVKRDYSFDVINLAHPRKIKLRDREALCYPSVTFLHMGR